MISHCVHNHKARKHSTRIKNQKLLIIWVIFSSKYVNFSLSIVGLTHFKVKHFWKIFTKILKKILAIIFQDVYYIKCCDVIAVKREVAAWEKSPAGYLRGANVKLQYWRQVTVPLQSATGQKRRVAWRTGAKVFNSLASRKHTGKCTVTACRKIAKIFN